MHTYFTDEGVVEHEFPGEGVDVTAVRLGVYSDARRRGVAPDVVHHPVDPDAPHGAVVHHLVAAPGDHDRALRVPDVVVAVVVDEHLFCLVIAVYNLRFELHLPIRTSNFNFNLPELKSTCPDNTTKWSFLIV